MRETDRCRLDSMPMTTYSSSLTDAEWTILEPLLGSIPLSTKQSTGELTIEVSTAQTQHGIDGGGIPTSP
jgi:hypothetical protein